MPKITLGDALDQIAASVGDRPMDGAVLIDAIYREVTPWRDLTDVIDPGRPVYTHKDWLVDGKQKGLYILSYQTHDIVVYIPAREEEPFVEPEQPLPKVAVELEICGHTYDPVWFVWRCRCGVGWDADQLVCEQCNEENPFIGKQFATP